MNSLKQIFFLYTKNVERKYSW